MRIKERAVKFGSQAYQLLPLQWRQSDYAARMVANEDGEFEMLKFHERFCRVLGGAPDMIIDVIRDVIKWYDSFTAPEDVLPYLAVNLGWMNDSVIPAPKRRLMLAHIHRVVYARKGTLHGIRLAILAFTGLQVSVWAPNNDPKALVLLQRITEVSEAIGPGTLADASGRFTVSSSTGMQLSPGDGIVVQHGGLLEAMTVEAVGSGWVSVRGGVRYLFPAGAVIFAGSQWQVGADGITRTPYGLDSGRLSYNTTARNLVRANISSENMMLDGSARLGFTGADLFVTDHEREMRFTFYIIVPVGIDIIEEWKLRVIHILADFMRPSRCHYAIKFGAGAVERSGAVVQAGQSALDVGARLE